jgi:hypothetical protein
MNASSPVESVGKNVFLCVTSAYSASRRWNSDQKRPHRGDTEYAEEAQSLFPTDSIGTECL